MQDVSETSLRRVLRRGQINRCDVAATSPRPTEDVKRSPIKESMKKSNICLISPRTSPQTTETQLSRHQVANLSPGHAVTLQ